MIFFKLKKPQMKLPSKIDLVYEIKAVEISHKFQARNLTVECGFVIYKQVLFDVRERLCHFIGNAKTRLFFVNKVSS